MNDEIIRILLVEDDPRDARLVSQWLADLPAEAGATPLFQVAHVRRLADSLAWLQAHPVDLMLFDLGLRQGRADADADGRTTVGESLRYATYYAQALSLGQQPHGRQTPQVVGADDLGWTLADPPA